MRDFANVLVVVGSLCLLITLVLAWCLVGVRSSAFMKRLFPNYQYLLKGHIDYLLMTGLLMIFFLLFSHFHVSPPPIVVLPRPIENRIADRPLVWIRKLTRSLSAIGMPCDFANWLL